MPSQREGHEIRRRVFGVGMNKTGTTSLKRCFGLLDLYPIAPNALESNEMKEAVAGLFERGDYEPVLKIAAAYRSFEDRPWNVWEMYQRLDERFPDSRFVLTIRDSESWWRSTSRWITVVKPRMAKKYLRHLRSPSLDREDMIAAYEQYNEGVIEYFAGSDKLLVIDFEKGQGWPELCAFLELPVPDLPFPHVNRQSYDEKDLERRRRDRQRSVDSGIPSRAAKLSSDKIRLELFCGTGGEGGGLETFQDQPNPQDYFIQDNWKGQNHPGAQIDAKHP